TRCVRAAPPPAPPRCTPVPYTTLFRSPAAQAEQQERARQNVKGSVAASTWAALIIGALVLILLLVFILQNQTEAQLVFFGWEWSFPIGIGMLIAAIAGALIMAMVGIVRMTQLRRQVKRGYK